MRVDKSRRHRLAYSFNTRQAHIKIPEGAPFVIERYIETVEFIDDKAETVVFTRYPEMPIVYERLLNGWQRVNFHAWKRRKKAFDLVDDE